MKCTFLSLSSTKLFSKVLVNIKKNIIIIKKEDKPSASLLYYIINIIKHSRTTIAEVE